MNVLVDKPKKFANNVVSGISHLLLVASYATQGWSTYYKQPYHCNSFKAAMEQFSKFPVKWIILLLVVPFIAPMLSHRRGWNSVLLIFVKIFPGWRDWIWPTYQLQISFLKLKRKLQRQPLGNWMLMMISRGRCFCKWPLIHLSFIYIVPAHKTEPGLGRGSYLLQLVGGKRKRKGSRERLDDRLNSITYTCIL